MKTPIIDFVKNYNKKNPARFHMPGHKGKGSLGEKFDLTEINGADVLYSANGIIEQSENNASKLFNTAHTFYSCEGSTLCIKAMLKLVTQGVSYPTIIATRNCHIAFINACALLGINVIWLCGKRNNLCSLDFDILELETAIAYSKNLCGVYITSPDYLGTLAPIEKISKICKNEHIPLLVDNAHASYSAFIKDNFHPITLGADLVCDSAHKTLPTLTGGAYLHVNKSSEKYLEFARKSLSLFASTSPSYLILQSLDGTNLYLQNNGNKFDVLVKKIENLKQSLKNYGYTIYGQDGFCEPLKLVIDVNEFGYTKQQFYAHLTKYKIEPEMIDFKFCVFMISPLNTCRNLKILKKALLSLEKKEPIKSRGISFPEHKKVLSIREATLRDCRKISVDSAEGSICASSIICCPPAVPLVVCGELITTEIIKLLKLYEIDYVWVIKN